MPSIGDAFRDWLNDWREFDARGKRYLKDRLEREAERKRAIEAGRVNPMMDMPPQGPISGLGPRPPAREWNVGTAQELQRQGNSPLVGQKLFREYLERNPADPNELGIDALGAIDDPGHIPRVRQIYAVKKHRM